MIQSFLYNRLAHICNISINYLIFSNKYHCILLNYTLTLQSLYPLHYLSGYYFTNEISLLSSFCKLKSCFSIFHLIIKIYWFLKGIKFNSMTRHFIYLLQIIKINSISQSIYSFKYFVIKIFFCLKNNKLYFSVSIEINTILLA